MCLTVDYYCICGVVARSQQVSCSDSFHLLDEQTHHMQQLALVLPREEWNARQGVCPQISCPHNVTSTMDASVTKCPGCSTLCGGDNWANGFDNFQKELEKELSGMDVDENTNDPEKNEDASDFQKKLERQLEIELSNMEVESDFNKAVFLERTLWDTHSCPVEFCPFNATSMAQAKEKLASIIAEMQRGTDPVAWTPEDDIQILDLSSHGADQELIANTVGRDVTGC